MLCRFDWLNQVCRHRRRDECQQLTTEKKKFTDAVNGKSGLTYWDALESEVCRHMTFT